MPRNKRRHPKKPGAKGPRGRKRVYYTPGDQPRGANALKQPGATLTPSKMRPTVEQTLRRGGL